MADGNQIKCPHCGQSYAVRPEQWPQYQGRTINCTKCGQAFTVTAPPSMVPPPPAGAAGMGSQAPGFTPESTGYASPSPPYQAQMFPTAPTQGNGWALTSLIFGILGFCVPLLGGIVAIVTGIIALTKTRDPRVGGRGQAIAGISLGGVSMVVAPVLLLMISIMLPALNRAREQANRVKCASNMRQLGNVMMLYANANRGHFPEKLEDVLQVDPTLSPTAFVCPSDDKAPPSATSIQTEAHEIAAGQHCSYIYVGNELTVNASPDTVLLYEPLADHHQEGATVLFVDGRVQWVSAADAQSILAQQAAGTRPVRLNPSP